METLYQFSSAKLIGVNFIENFKGWVSKKNIWGVNQNETFKLSYLQNIQDLYWLSINLLRKNFY